MFEKFKREIKDYDINLLNKELQKRKELLFNWNQPNERMVNVELAGKEGFKTYCKHPYYKIRKEIAIINTFIQQIHLRTLQGGQ